MVSNCLIKSLASLETCPQSSTLKLTSAFLIYSKTLAAFSLMKGGVPQSKTYMMTPKDQLSHSTEYLLNEELPAFQHLGGDIERGSNLGVKWVVLAELLRQAEIDDFYFCICMRRRKQ